MPSTIVIREFSATHAQGVRELFVSVNRLLAPVGQEAVFEDYINSSLKDEIDRIDQYYGDRNGQFWVALEEDKVVGMFGLESSGPNAMELRRMYVDPDYRRRGIAQMMLHQAESYCRENQKPRLDLSTSEIQSDAISFYQSVGYELVREEVANEASNKTVGGGIRRYHYKKEL